MDKIKVFEGIQYKSAKTRKGMVVGFVTFKMVEQVKIAIEWMPIPGLINNAEDGGAVNDGSTPGSADVKVRSSRDAVTPLTHLSYPDQLEQKTKSISQILKKLARNTCKACSDGFSLPGWINKSKDIGSVASSGSEGKAKSAGDESTEVDT
ncbi:zinc finger (CCCH-type) family protein [Artemisia annua]|uniref:Zinc finger (CCCH-type) family protein n=1 Tax=Artemisia annua TaxID=35608 RepID=A0A2U1KTM7_ARTAN|nr:zinc finger (CCCH-type) family protein [Artemisia annua]